MTFVKHLAAQVTGENGPYDLVRRAISMAEKYRSC